MFTNIIARRPGKSLIDGITGYADYGKPDYDLALHQHDKYLEALEKCGVAMEVLEADEEYPDSCFVEDVAVMTGKFALITNPGAPSRNGEKDRIAGTIEKYRKNLEFITAPGTLEGGDVMMVGDHFYIGLSKRTNEEGARQFVAFLEKYGYSGSTVPVQGILHLKTGMSYQENNNLLITEQYYNNPEFRTFNRILVDPKDHYSSNCIWLNGHVIVPEGFEKTGDRLARLGYEIHLVGMSEFMKLDGGLSCLSLRF